MNSRERVMTALRRGEPDRVPYCELSVDRALARQLLGWQEGEARNQRANKETNAYTVEEARAVAAALKLDNLSYVLRAPVYTEKVPGLDGRLFYGRGLIQSEADLAMVELPDPYDDALYTEAESFCRNKGDYALFFVTRIGIFPTMLSMGIEGFSVALYENLGLVETLLDLYCDWQAAVAERVCKMGFDVFISTDDMAFNSAPLFSPRVFHELVLPRFRRVAEHITLPWVIHSDGNVLPLLDDLLSLGIAGLHPLEKNAVDVRALKRDYGDRICLLGNVDLNLLGMGPAQAVDEEVRGLIRDVAPGGGYVVTSGNSLAGYLLPDNVRALTEAVHKYGQYPIDLD
ncbi:MAG: hypothetical protein JXA74_07380 [Anaerolineae bacterium]|nr:hypothetical protein [Anaerolineae bacterium]